MESYDKEDTAVNLLKESLDIFAGGEVFHDTFSRNAHMKGLRGFKRWHEMEANKDRNKRIEVQHYVINQFGKDLDIEWDYSIKVPTDIKEHLKMYLEWEISVYKTISRIGNELIKENFIEEGELILESLKSVKEEIKNIRRWIQDLEFTEYERIYIKMIDKIIFDRLEE